MQLHELLRLAKEEGVTDDIREAIRTKQIVAIVGPSGAGKTEIVKGMIERWDKLERVVTSTSREVRPGEQRDVDYHYFKRSTFSEGIGRGMFLEHDEYGGAFYGTGIVQLMRIWVNGKIPVLNLSLRGITQLRPMFDSPQTVFLDVTELETLERRIRARKGVTPEKLQARLNEARSERANWRSSCDVRVVNDDGPENFTRAVEEVMSIAGNYVLGEKVAKYTGS